MIQTPIYRYKIKKSTIIIIINNNVKDNIDLSMVKSKKTLHKIKFDNDSHFNSKIINIPSTITHIDLSGCYWYNKPLDWLPSNIINIEICGEFNQPIDNLPLSLKSLKIESEDFNQSINKLPPKLEQLIINADNISTPIISLPFGLKKLDLDLNLDEECMIKIKKLPSKLTHFCCFLGFEFPSNFNFPKNIKYLKIGITSFEKYINILPKKIKFLYIDFCWANYANINYDELFKKIPSTVTHLYLKNIDGYGNECKYSINNLPPKLKLLSIKGQHFNTTINFFPLTLKTLIIDSETFNKPLNLPSNLKQLSIKSPEWNQSLDNLPSNLKQLTIKSHKWNQSLDNLPSGLETLNLWYLFGFDKSLDNLPTNLKSLSIIHHKYMGSFDYLPSSLTRLELYGVVLKCNMENLPSGLKSLKLIDIEINNEQQIDIQLLPVNLETLILDFVLGFDTSLSTTNNVNFPPKLKNLMLGSCCCFSYDLNNLPNSLNYLTIKNQNYNKPIISLPESIKCIFMGIDDSCKFTKQSNVKMIPQKYLKIVKPYNGN